MVEDCSEESVQIVADTATLALQVTRTLDQIKMQSLDARNSLGLRVILRAGRERRVYIRRSVGHAASDIALHWPA